MSGVSDLPFRRLAARFGAGMVVSEMVASESFVRGDAETQMRAESQDDGLHVVQLAGREARWMGEAARVIADLGADVIDINMGCPAKKVTSGYSGSALMRDLDHALTLIEATVEAVDIPVTLKMRLGWDDASINAPDLARRAEAAGVQLITVHGRTRCQFYKGRADWHGDCSGQGGGVGAADCQWRLQGDSTTPRRCWSSSGADGVMIGRGAYGRPWLPGHVGHFLATGERLAEPSGTELADLVVEHYEALLEPLWRTGRAPDRAQASRVVPGCRPRQQGAAPLPGAFRKTLMTSQCPADVIRLANEWFSTSNERTAA